MGATSIKRYFEIVDDDKRFPLETRINSDNSISLKRVCLVGEENVTLSLDEAKALHEVLTSVIAIVSSKVDELDVELKHLIRTGQFIQAVKTHREKRGSGLKESKEYCDNLRNFMG